MEAAVSSIVLILFIFQRIIIPEEAGWAHYSKENGKKNQNLIAPDLEGGIDSSLSFLEFAECVDLPAGDGEGLRKDGPRDGLGAGRHRQRAVVPVHR